MQLETSEKNIEISQETNIKPNIAKYKHKPIKYFIYSVHIKHSLFVNMASIWQEFILSKSITLIL